MTLALPITGNLVDYREVVSLFCSNKSLFSSKRIAVYLIKRGPISCQPSEGDALRCVASGFPWEPRLWIKRVESCLRPARLNVSGGECHITRPAVPKGEMLLADCVGTFTICRLQGAKYSYVTGLKLMGSVRRKPTENDVVFKTEFHDFEWLTCPEAITYKNPWLLIR